MGTKLNSCYEELHFWYCNDFRYTCLFFQNTFQWGLIHNDVLSDRSHLKIKSRSRREGWYKIWKSTESFLSSFVSFVGVIYMIYIYIYIYIHIICIYIVCMQVCMYVCMYVCIYVLKKLKTITFNVLAIYI